MPGFSLTWVFQNKCTSPLSLKKSLLLSLYLQLSLSGQKMLCLHFHSLRDTAPVFPVFTFPFPLSLKQAWVCVSCLPCSGQFLRSQASWVMRRYLCLSLGISFPRPTRWSIFIYELNSSLNAGKSSSILLIILFWCFREKMTIDAGQRKMKRRCQHSPDGSTPWLPLGVSPLLQTRDPES